MFKYEIVWDLATISIAVNYSIGEPTMQLTDFYCWPQTFDFWQLLREDLNRKPWLKNKEKKVILNEIAFIINFWNKNRKVPLDKLGLINNKSVAPALPLILNDLVNVNMLKTLN